MLTDFHAITAPAPRNSTARRSSGETGPIPLPCDIRRLRRLRFNAAGLERLERLTGRSMLFEQGDCLLRPGYPFYDLYAVRSGRLRSSMTYADGRHSGSRDYLPGDVIGHAALIAGWYGSDLVALERSTLCPIPLEMLAELCASVHTTH